MSNNIKLKKGFDINLAGKAEKRIADAPQPETFSYKPTSFNGMLRPKLLVDVGDNVKAGTPILFDKKSDRIMHVAPVSGEVVEIRRGEKRKLLEIVILADKDIISEDFNAISEPDALSREEVINHMLRTGVWVNLVERPFGCIANPDATPKNIFVSCFDSSPLAPDYDFIFQGQGEYFQKGLDVLKKLTDGDVQLGLSRDTESSSIFSASKGVSVNTFSGPHPAGNVGVQIHHTAPINKGDVVWTINPFGVIQLGKLFKEGKYDASKVVALTGSEVKNTQYYRTYSGANIKNLVNGNVNAGNHRYISGNVLTGKGIGPEGHMGYFDHQVTVIPEGDHYEMFGWIKPTTNKLSFQRAFGLLGFLNSNKEFVVDTNTKGELRAFVQTGVFERVLPMDILPGYLIKAIMAEDFDDMEALGIYEVIEEDLALCEFVDVSKNDIQSILREGLDLLRYS